MNGASLDDAMNATKEILRAERDHEEVLEAVESAERYAATQDLNALRDGRLGEGWIAEEALSIALYCAFLFRDFEDAVIEAVNHSGDSDSTGAITGNICGALYGVESIPDRWLGQLELRSEITEIADDLAALDTGVFDASSEIAWQRYPGH